MKTGTCLKGALSACLLLLACSLVVPSASRASEGTIGEGEAVAIADLWYAMELNAAHSGIGEQERAARLARLSSHTVSYFVTGGQLAKSPPAGGPVLAYVVEYEPAGYVVVAGTDRLQAILAHSLESDFWWDEPGLDLVRADASRGLEGMGQGLPAATHPSWAALRAKLSQGESLRAVSFPQADSSILWDTALWDQGWPYNEVVAAQNGNNPSVPTGCTATAMAIKFRFHQWPLTCSGPLSYCDSQGSVQFCHSVNCAAHTYLWANMPLPNLTVSNPDVATLMYHCGVAIHANYEAGGTEGWASEGLLEPAFQYKGTEYIFTPDVGGSAHVLPLKRSLYGGLVILVGSDSHTMVATGYRDQLGVEEFWINHGHGGSSNGWQTLAWADVKNSWPYSSPANYIYVDAAWSGEELGWIQKPFNTFQEGLSVVPDGGQLWLKAGTYTGVPIILTRPMVIRSHEGPATLTP